MTHRSTDALREAVERLAAAPASSDGSAESVISELLEALESGVVRSAERDAEGDWNAVEWVKRGILHGFRMGQLVDMSPAPGSPFRFFDKHTYPVLPLTVEHGVRVVPGGSSIRRGAYVARGVVCMPPMYINVGAWVDSGTMVDSHALVGSCAQIGHRVHLSAAAQVGGVLEPVNAAPVIIEDDAFIGGNCGVYEGTVVRRRAVLAPGVLLTRGTPVYDTVHERVLRADRQRPLEIPEGAVLVPGGRAVRSEWGAAHGLVMNAPIIVKYRDEGTDAGTALEGSLR